MITLAAFVSVLSLGAQDPALSAEDVSILWKERERPVAELEQTLAADSFKDALQWARWARIHGYTAALDDSARVLVLQPQGRRPKPRSRGGPAPLAARSQSDNTRLAQKLEHIDYVLARADELFPMPTDPPVAVATGQGSAPSEGPYEEWEQFGERLDKPSNGSGDEAEEGYVYTEWSTGSSGAAPRDHLPTLIELRDATDQKTLLADLQRDHPYIQSWAAGAGKYSGFLLTKPLLGAWLLSGEGLEEWSPKHELVNRATRLVLSRRHGLMPEWLSLGLGWQFEFDRFQTMYCFPRRDEFVFATEHSDWDKTLRQQFKKVERLRMRELLVERDAKYRAEDATRSWGAAEFLVRRHPDDLAPLLDALSLDRMQNGRTTNENGTWELIKDYEAPGDRQAELLASHMGADVFERMLEFMRAGGR